MHHKSSPTLRMFVLAFLASTALTSPVDAQSVTVTGDVTPGGATSPDWSASDIHVGNTATGSLQISNSGTVSSGDSVWIGYQPSGIGDVLVTGLGSKLAADAYLVVAMDGQGSLTVENGAEVTAWQGETGKEVGSVGTIIVTGNGSSLKNRAGYEVGRYGSGTLTVSDGGTFAVGLSTIGIDNKTIQVALYSGSTGTINIGSAAGDAATRAGIISAERIRFGNGHGSLVFNHTDTDYSFDTPLSGNGTIKHLAGTTLLSADSTAFTGLSTVSGGSLFLDDALLGGTIDVFGTGVFGGNGIAGRVGATNTIGNGGTLSPGLSGAVGTLNVNGDLVFDAGSTYAVDVSTSTSDLTSVSGAVTINGGTLAVTLLDPQTSYQDYQTYQILTATGGITGDFTTLAHNSAFLDVSYEIVGDDLILSLGIDNSFGGFSGAAQTGNQKAVAGALDTLSQSGQSLELFNALLPMSAGDARYAFDELAGEIHATSSSMLIGGAQSVNSMINDRMMGSNTAPANTNSFQPLGYVKEAVPANTGQQFARFDAEEKQTYQPDRLGIWASGFGAWSNIDGRDGTLSSKVSTGGFMIGADGMITEDWKLGLYGGYSGSLARTDREKIESDNYHVGIYGGRDWGAFSFRAGASYIFSSLDTARTVTSLNQRLTADYDADTLNLFGEFGHKTALGDTVLEPFVNLAHVSVKSEGFAETGGSAALTVYGQSTDTTTSTLGLRAARVVAVGESTAKIRGMIGWQHAFGDTASRSTVRFLTGDDFTISNAPLDENALVVEAGMDFNLTTNATLALSYRGRIGADARDHMANANLKVAF